MKLNSKEIHENFARFFEKPTREGLREFFQTNIGELDHCDFKKDWPSFPKVAKLILGLANSGGGCIILGLMTRHCSLPGSVLLLIKLR